MQRLEAGPALVSSNSFRVEYNPNVSDQEMKDHIVSYLGEFRFGLQKYNYNLALLKQVNSWRLSDSYLGESMTTKAFKSVMERRALGEPTHREEAELAGLTFLEQQLGEAQIGDSIIWFSPPGPESEGYGDYGFGFDGEIIEESEGKKMIRMTANRFEKPTLEQFNEAFVLLVGSGFNGQHADDFLRMPVVIKGGLPDELIESVFFRCFGFVYDPSQRAKFDGVIRVRVSPLIDEFISSTKGMSNYQRVTSIHAMENIVTEARKAKNIGTFLIQRQVSNLSEAREQYGHEPERVAGSCPVKSNNPLEDGLDASGIFDGINYEFKDFGPCKECDSETNLGPCKVCLKCDIKIRRKKKLGMAA